MNIEKLTSIMDSKTFKNIIESKGNSTFDKNSEYFMELVELYPSEFLAKTGLPNLIKLCIHEIWPNSDSLYDAYLKTKVFRGDRKFCNTLENLKILYGEHGGLVIFENKNKKHNASMLGKRGDINLKNKGYSDKDLSEYRKMISDKIWETRYRLAEESGDPLYFAKRSLASKHYDGNSTQTREDYLSETLDKGRTAAAHLKRIQTRKSRFDDPNYVCKFRGKTGSKPAKTFLTPIAKYLDCLGIQYRWSDNYEYWVRNKDTSELFFIDFCSNDLQLAIEFHGIKYHPKSPNDENFCPPSFVKLLSAKEKWEYDKRKELTIMNAGYKLFIVFEDDDLQEKQKEILEWIDEKYVSKV